ncbi:hypothetical protein LF887_18755 [Chryseobacterium sp. MEBOG06]|uniref:hypothetical protein n=1 Tax=Chryseobacterium sp. MEBOG06 TaxID=2879938 RepID=UPI001F2B2A0A|nr:hypothetical protein [Chryseobacterium sp. MEBOG06]UKB83032.1 hypothetical protein LF887_18755 [Chryseobacterium sp. MEBOG06]
MMTIQKHKFKYIFLFIIFFLFSVKGFAANYYWVGGSGNWSDIGHWRTTSGGTSIPSVVPGPMDDVFFDANSGFTAANKTVSVNVIANCRNITFSGSTVAPNVNSDYQKGLNIYGSSEWQLGMIVNVSSFYYRNTNTPKTIKSNGAIMRVSNILFEEETSISFLDDFSTSETLVHNAGILNTNDHKVSLGKYVGNDGTKPRTINMGSSEFYIRDSFSANKSFLTLNSGTSHIHFSGYSSTLFPFAGQTYYNISFEGPDGILGYDHYNQTVGKVYFNRVEFKGNGKLLKNNEIKELIFTEGKIYSLQNGYTQTITSSLAAHSPNCGGWITINSSIPGIQAKLIAASGVSIDVSRAIIKDIQTSGGAVFAAAGSNDNGNNTGWTFPATAGQDLYWVGGSGNWNDKTHWAQTSGGTGGYCVPGPSDNVFFDANSGFTTTSKIVTLTSASYCHHIKVSGSVVAPTLYGPETELNIFGSSEWQAGMKVDIRYIYYRNNNKIRTIKSNGVSVGTEVYFEEENTISLLDDFSVSSTLYHQAGVWNTNGYKVTLESYKGDEGSKPRTLSMGSSDFYIKEGDFSADSPLLTLNSGTSVIHFLGQVSMLKPYAGQVYYNVNFEYSGTVPARFGYNQRSKVYYNRVEFKYNGEIKGDNQIRELIFTEGKTYTLASSSTQTVTSLFRAHSQGCGDWVTINSSINGTQAKIVALSGVSIDVSRALLRDIQASGGAVFTAVGSMDNGNNTGWTFPVSAAQNLYWVGGGGNWNDTMHWAQTSGGTGGSCVPGPTDNVFFDANSGFTESAKLIILSSGSYCHNIVFSGNTAAPVLSGSGTELNIYGSSEWQSGMRLEIGSVYYRNTNTPKTLRSNGVSTGSQIYFEEENTISLLDDFSGSDVLYHLAGTWNTNNHQVSLGRYIGDSGTQPRTLNMGSSDFYLSFQSFSASSSLLTLNSGTSHIHFLFSSSRLLPFPGQTYYNVSFEGTDGSLGYAYSQATAKVYYNRVEFKGNGSFIKDNQIKELILTAGKTYILDAGNTQTVTDKLYASGNSCFILFLKSSVPGTKANLNVMGGSTGFDFANVKDINASGETLNFGSKSTNVENNFNMTFDPYDPSAFSGFAGQDWSHAKFKNNDPDSYTLSSAGFYGNPYTTYKWSKINDPAHTGTIATGSTLDMRSFGYGTYHIKVEYSAPGSPDYCVVEESIMVKSFVPSMINPGLPIRNY